MTHQTSTRPSLRELFCSGVSLSSIASVARFWNRRRALIVMYHGVVPDGRPYQNWGQLPESRFRQQLEHLARHYRVMPLREIVACIREGRPLPPNAAAITFDDGFLNNATVAWPHLRELGLPATIFLVTGHVDTDKLLWPDELFALVWHAIARGIDCELLETSRADLRSSQKLQTAYRRILAKLKQVPASRKNDLLATLREQIGKPLACSHWISDFHLMTWDDAQRLSDGGGIEFGAHTEHHEILTRLSAERAAMEIRASIETVRRHTGQREVPFAYPNGESQDFNPLIVDMVREAGANCALTTCDGRNANTADLFRLRRTPVDAELGPRDFEVRCTGLMGGIRQFCSPWRRSRSSRQEPRSARRDGSCLDLPRMPAEADEIALLEGALSAK